MADTKTLVITGAAGRIGTFYRQHFGQRKGWQLRLQDIRPVENLGKATVLTGDLASFDHAQEVVAGAHTVLHLAADPSTRAEFYATLLDRNIKATYNVFQAAAEAGVQRVIFASSINAILGYPEHVQVHTHMVARPANVYGATKAWGEALAATYVAEDKLPSAIAIRIGGVTHRDSIQPDWDTRRLSWIVTHEDLCQLFDCCVNAGPEVNFAVVHGISNNKFVKMEIESTHRLVHYTPHDDAFAIAASKQR